MLDLARLVLVPVQDARDDLDVVLLGEGLAELGEEVRGGLDAGPVVLVQDEDSLSFHGGQASSDLAAASRTAARNPSTLGP